MAYFRKIDACKVLKVIGRNQSGRKADQSILMRRCSRVRVCMVFVILRWTCLFISATALSRVLSLSCKNEFFDIRLC